MKRLIFPISFLLYCCVTIYSQSGWFWQNPLPQGNSLYSVKLVDQNTGFAGGKCGTILKTTNRGANWKIMSTDSSYICTSFYFQNNNTGWVTCSKDMTNTIYYLGAKIMKTNNSGNNWIEKFNILGCYMYSIEFTSLDTAYVTAHNNMSFGLVYKTVNGGQNWVQQYAIQNYSIYNSCFINNNTGYICGTFGIKKTTDGGNSWVNQLSGINPPKTLNSIYFVNNNTGFSVGYITSYPTSSQAIYKTTNAGINWILQTGSGNSSLKDVCFLNENTGFACSNILIFTTNSGVNWSNVVMQESFNCMSIDMKLSNGIMVDTYGKIFNSTNYGTTWNYNYTSAHDGYGALCLKFLNKNTGYAISGTKLLRTSNGGNNWFSLNTASSYSLNALSVVDNNIIFVAGGELSGGSPVLFKSTNSGLSWVSQNSQQPHGICSIYFVNPNVGYCMSWQGISKTTNGGNNWISIGSLTGSVKSLYFVNENTGFVSAFTAAHKTTNGGMNWTTIPADGESIFFLNENTGYAAGMGMMIRKTTNGGINWVIQAQSSDGWRFYGIHFFNSQIGYAIGDFGAIAKTTNGGINWYYQKSPTNNLLASVYVTDTNECYVSGVNNTILKTTNGGVPIGIEPITSEKPIYFSLSQNYPNPFNPSTTIKFDIPKSLHVKIVVYDLLGREVEELLNEERKPGSYEVMWDGNNYPSGIYFYRLITETYSESKRMVLLK
ncbi:MAG: T9SS C-terminal target domain-containing protein [Ignavibacteriae bacterium]|nr:MAG: T9SS C-terminal target domain-containing protein [Ignavibacteriota bacterium]